MPRRSCCVSSCMSKLSEGAILQSFPHPERDQKRFQMWIKNIGGELTTMDSEIIYTHKRICRKHFETMYHYASNRLSKIAVPTLLLSDAEHTMPEKNISVHINEPTTSYAGISSGIDAEHTVLEKKFPVHINEPTTSYAGISSGIDQPIAMKKYQTLELELQKQVMKTSMLMRQCKKTKSGLLKKLRVMKKLQKSTEYKTITKKLSPAAKIFFNMQLKQSHKQPKGRRFTIEEKILALSLYKPSPRAYRILSQVCVLPKRSTLNQLLSKVSLKPGINDIIFEHLKRRVAKMPKPHTYCTLIFDEMAIAANVHYDKKKDYIKGFCDNGVDQVQTFCNHVLVFMVRGIFKKYKQPVSYSFCTGSTKKHDLKMQIIDIIRLLQTAGLKVIATTCDQGAGNMAAINSFINDTKEKYLREGKDWRGGFFEIDGENIFPIYDPPHLLKGIRNNLLTKDLVFIVDGKKHIAKWAHLCELHKRGPGYKGVRLVPKLTDRHIMPNLIPKMKVKNCTQVFSRSVSVALGFMADIGKLPNESKDTADLLMFFDELFDSVNGSFSQPVDGKIFRSAVTPKSPHHGLWRKSIQILKTMQFVTKDGKIGTVPSISSWVKTIEAFQNLTKKIFGVGLNSILLRNFNQDPLENFFGAVRAHGHSNVMPSASQFEATYKILLINNITSSHSIGANCEKDDTYCLQSLKYFLIEDIQENNDNTLLTDIDPAHLNINFIEMDVLVGSDARVDVEKCAATAYCSGWLLSILQKKTFFNCSNCKSCLESDSENDFSKFITLKKFSDTSILHYPTKQLFNCFLQIEQITHEVLRTCSHKFDIAKYIELISTINIDFNFIKCCTHQERLKAYLLNRSVVFFINVWCKEINQILTGKMPNWDLEDPIKQRAYDCYLRHKHK